MSSSVLRKGDVFVLCLLLFVTRSVTCETDQSGSCKKEAGSDSSGGCGCSINRVHTDGVDVEVAEMPDTDHEHEKYTTERQHDHERTHQMVHIPGGTFIMGTNKPVFVADGEGPERKTTVDDFYLDKFEVSNREFDLFVKETGYKTEASIN